MSLAAPAALPVPVPDDAHLVMGGLGLRRGDRWLFRGLDLRVPRGTCLAVIGPSGAGKSSLLACLAGILPPSEGEVRYVDAGGSARMPAALRGHLGLVFQDLRLVPNLSLLDNVLCGRLGRRAWWATAAGLPREGRDEALALLEGLGLGSLAGAWAGQVSGGEQQRAAIARALFMEPEVVLADEPVSAVDPDGAERALALARQETSRRGATLVCVLHDRPLVERFADQTLVLDPREPLGWRLERSRAAWSPEG